MVCLFVCLRCVCVCGMCVKCGWCVYLVCGECVCVCEPVCVCGECVCGV